MTDHAWGGIEPPSDDDMDELRIEIAATIDDHAETHKKGHTVSSSTLASSVQNSATQQCFRQDAPPTSQAS